MILVNLSLRLLKKLINIINEMKFVLTILNKFYAEFFFKFFYDGCWISDMRGRILKEEIDLKFIRVHHAS